MLDDGHNDPERQEAARALANIGWDDPVIKRAILRLAAVPRLVKLLQCHSEEAQKQAVWALERLGFVDPSTL